MLTKRPGDIFQIEEILSFYDVLKTCPRFILLMRDPRAVLTSIHERSSHRYSCSSKRWKATWDYWAWAKQFPECLVARYEELIRRPAVVGRQIGEHVGWTYDRPLDQFHRHVPSGFRTTALNGLRPLDNSNIQRWRAPWHADRLREVLADLPELPQILIELGYAQDDSWVSRLEQHRSRAA